MGALDATIATGVAGDNNPQAQAPKTAVVAESASWGHYFKSLADTGASWTLTGAAGWQGGAIFSAWAPTLIMNNAVANSGWIMGGLFYGPAAVKVAAPLIALGSGAAGLAASALAALAIVGTKKAVTAGVNAVGNQIEQYGNKCAQRKAQHESINTDTDNGVMAFDDWDELTTPEDRLAILEAKLSNEKSASARGLIAGEISKEYSNIAIANFRRNLDL